jgi:hypothetical protein
VIKSLHVPTGFLFSGVLLMIPVRRSLLKGGAAVGALMLAPTWLHAQTSDSPAERRFSPQVGPWRTFEVTTRVDLADPVGPTRIWLPMPSLNTDWQRSLESRYNSNGQSQMGSDGVEGARMLFSAFADGVKPFVEITSRVQTRNRRAEWNAPAVPAFARQDAATLKHYTRSTQLLPTDGIVRSTALKATQGAQTDVQKAHAIYDWVVQNAWREPKVRG